MLLLPYRLFARAFQVLLQGSFKRLFLKRESPTMLYRIGAGKCSAEGAQANQSRLQRAFETLVRHLSSPLHGFQSMTVFQLLHCKITHPAWSEKLTRWYIMISRLEQQLSDNLSRCLEQHFPESFSRHEHFQDNEGTEYLDHFNRSSLLQVTF